MWVGGWVGATIIALECVTIFAPCFCAVAEMVAFCLAMPQRTRLVCALEIEHAVCRMGKAASLIGATPTIGNELAWGHWHWRRRRRRRRNSKAGCCCFNNMVQYMYKDKTSANNLMVRLHCVNAVCLETSRKGRKCMKNG